MTKKLNIKGVIVYYGNVKTWNGRIWTKRELQAYYKKSERDYQEARRKEHEAEQAEKNRKRQEELAYQASLNVPTGNHTASTLESDSEIRASALILLAVTIGGCLLAFALGLLALG